MSILKRKPRIGITLGDVAGIGPEIAVKAYGNPRVEQICTPILIGESTTVKHYVSQMAPAKEVRIISDPEQVSSESQQLQMLDLKNVSFSQVTLGRSMQSVERLRWITSGQASHSAWTKSSMPW
jgi:4-hydroxy-L-threonine phosphate dehydrogenase PdxA